MLSGTLPDELVVDILTRVPPKPLVRFTSVSKLWYFLIKKPSFIKTHLEKSLANDGNGGSLLFVPADYNQERVCTLFCGSTLGELEKLKLPFRCDLMYCTTVGSVNGLVCLVDGCELYLFNPAIRKYKQIGYSSSIRGFFPACPYEVIGFGYHRQTDDYKVVRMNVAKDDHGKTSREVEVYSLNEGGWRKVGGEFEWITLNQLPAALVNGNLHWIVSSLKPEIDQMVLSFDLGEEIFREIMLPHLQVSGFRLMGSLCVLKESLSLFVDCPCRELEGGSKCYLWVMKEYGVSNSWIKPFTIDTGGRVERLLGITKFNELLLKTEDDKMVSYDLENHQTKCSSATFEGLSTFDVVPLIESLLFFEGGDGRAGKAHLKEPVAWEPVLHSQKKRIVEEDLKTNNRDKASMKKQNIGKHGHLQK